MSAGMAYEAMNNAGARNDAADRHPQRQRHVDRAAGRRDVRLSGAARLRPHLSALRDVGKQLAKHLPKQLGPRHHAARPSTRAASSPAARCSRSSASTTSARSTATISTTCCRCCATCATPRSGPILVHVVTQKGKGYAPAETSADKYHGVAKFDVVTGAQAKSKAGAPPYTKVFAESLIKEARKDDKIVAITAAMPSGTGLDLFARGVSRRAASTSASPSSTR